MTCGLFLILHHVLCVLAIGPGTSTEFTETWILSESGRYRWIIWPSEDIHCITHRRTEQLRVMLCNKVFTASMVANGLEPGSIWLQLMYKFSSLDHIAKKRILEVK